MLVRTSFVGMKSREIMLMCGKGKTMRRVNRSELITFLEVMFSRVEECVRQPSRQESAPTADGGRGATGGRGDGTPGVPGQKVIVLCPVSCSTHREGVKLAAPVPHIPYYCFMVGNKVSQ